MTKNRLFRNVAPVVLIFCYLFLCSITHAQEFDLLLKGGHVIDPKNNIDADLDVAILNKKIQKVAANIPANSSKKVIDVKGLYVTPGLIDMHAHHFPTISSYRVGDPFPDGFTFRCGITTTIDAGSSGWKSFPEFKKQIIDVSKTRVLAWLNIVGQGYLGREPYEQDNGDMDSRLTALQISKYKEFIIGVKVAHYTGNDFIPVDRAVEAGKQANVPMMVDFGEHSPPLSIEELFMKHFRPGDIFTHCYANGPKSRETIVDENGKVKPFVFEARKKGVIFDVGHGGGAFSFSQAIPALEQNFPPNSISSDWNRSSTNGAMKDLLNVMSKFLAMGVDLPTVIKMTTMNPAKQINREELGNLSVGAEADIAVFNLRKGNFGFQDVKKTRIMGTEKLEAELTIRAGEIVWDLNGLSVEKWTKNAQALSNPVDIMYAGTSPGNNSKGIYVLQFDRKTNTLSELTTVNEKRNPNFLAQHPNGNYLYAIYSEGMSDEDKRGTVMSFSIDPSTGFIKKLNEQSTEGRGPAHVSIDPKGRFAYVANYGEGNFTIYRIGADGRLSPAQQVLQFEGGSGVDTARQKHPFMHSVIPSSDGKFIYASSLGSDKIFIYEVKDAGDFVPAHTPYASSTPGSGPRHFIIHPNGRFAYSVEEMSSSVASYKRDINTGALTPLERFLPVPDTFTAKSSGADIHFSPDAEYLYVSIRGLNNIVIYAVNSKTGKLKFVGREDGHGDHPRNFCVDKKGEYVFVENMRSNNIAIFKRDKISGKMTFVRDEMIAGVACLIQH